MIYQKDVDKQLTRYLKPHRKISHQLEVDPLSFDDFMVGHQIQDEEECLRCMIEYFNDITPKFEDGFHIRSNKIKIFAMQS